MPSLFSKIKRTDTEKLSSYFEERDIHLSQEEIQNVMDENPETFYKIGDIYSKRQNYPKALRWYKKSARQNYADAQNEIGWMYRNGLGVEKDMNEALEYYRLAAQNGSNIAQNNIGFMYCNGIGVQKSYQVALFWYQKAASNDNPHAQNNLGYMYEHGLGVTQDYTEALDWYMKAGLNESISAQVSVGRFYQNGLGVAKNINLAIEWFLKADSSGNKFASYNLGWIYEFENEVRDKQQAMKWYEKCANRGNKDAKSRLKIVLNKDFSIKVEPKRDEKMEYRWEIEEMSLEPDENKKKEDPIPDNDYSTLFINRRQEHEVKIAEKAMIKSHKKMEELEQRVAQLIVSTNDSKVTDDPQNDLYYDDSSDEETISKS